MRKTIILGSILALAGFASVAQASDWSKGSDHDAVRGHRESSDDSHGERHDQYKRNYRSREHHDEFGEQRRESRAMHDEANERRDRR